MIEALKEEIRILQLRVNVNSTQEKFRSGQVALEKDILADMARLEELKAKLAATEKPAKKKNRKRDD